MSVRNIILIALALLITAGTTVVARSWLAAQRAQPVTAAQPAPEPEGVKVLVAKIALPTGVFIQEDQLRWQIWPVDNLQETYRSEEHTSELPSLMSTSYAVCCLKKKNKHNNILIT